MEQLADAVQMEELCLGAEATAEPDPPRPVEHIGLKLLRVAAAALGWTTLAVTSLLEPLVRMDGHIGLYHWSGRASTLFGPVILIVVAGWAALTVLLWLTQRRGRARVAVWAGLIVSTPWVLVNAMAVAWPRWMPAWLHLPPFALAMGGLVLLVVFWNPSFEPHFEECIAFGTTILSLLAISGAVYLGELGVFWWNARALNDPLPLHTPEPVALARASAKPRVIWIIFDELAYAQVYEHRYPGLKLPAFDALANQSAVLTEVAPPGVRTERVVPSLLTGEPVVDIRSSLRGGLLLRNADRRPWVAFDQHNSVFQDALNDGYSTAVVGWFNPYCRILPAVLDQCYWSYEDPIQNLYFPTESFKSNLLQALGVSLGSGTMHRLLSPLLPLPVQRAVYPEMHVEDYQKLAGAADHVLADRSAGFVLLHMPVPHPEGIYNRTTRQLVSGGATYIDNLALADRYLDHVRRLLELSGQWDSTTLVVIGDHSWRTHFLWARTPRWTTAEQRASQGGQYDPRPGYIVKFAGEQTGMRIDSPFRSQNTRRLLDGIFTGKIASPEALREWIEKVPEASPGPTPLRVASVPVVADVK